MQAIIVALNEVQEVITFWLTNKTSYGLSRILGSKIFSTNTIEIEQAPPLNDEQYPCYL